MSQLEEKFSGIIVHLEQLHRELPISHQEDVGATWLRVYQALQMLELELNRTFERSLALRVAMSFLQAWRNTRASELTQFTIQEFAGLIVIVQVVSSERDLTPDEADELESNLQRVYLCPRISFGEAIVAQA